MSAPETRRSGLGPTLCVIIVIKLVKGLLLLAIGIGLLNLSGPGLDAQLDQFLRWIHLDPERQFFAALGDKLQQIRPENIRGVGIGTMLHSLLSLGEGVGLIFRRRWAGWLVIGEALFFIPLEVYDLLHTFSGIVFGVLLVNLWIVWYLVANKERLFKHQHWA